MGLILLIVLVILLLGALPRWNDFKPWGRGSSAVLGVVLAAVLAVVLVDRIPRGL